MHNPGGFSLRKPLVKPCVVLQQALKLCVRCLWIGARMPLPSCSQRVVALTDPTALLLLLPMGGGRSNQGHTELMPGRMGPSPVSVSLLSALHAVVQSQELSCPQIRGCPAGLVWILACGGAVLTAVLRGRTPAWQAGKSCPACLPRHRPAAAF